MGRDEVLAGAVEQHQHVFTGQAAQRGQFAGAPRATAEIQPGDIAQGIRHRGRRAGLQLGPINHGDMSRIVENRQRIRGAVNGNRFDPLWGIILGDVPLGDVPLGDVPLGKVPPVFFGAREGGGGGQRDRQGGEPQQGREAAWAMHESELLASEW